MFPDSQRRGRKGRDISEEKKKLNFFCKNANHQLRGAALGCCLKATERPTLSAEEPPWVKSGAWNAGFHGGLLAALG